MENLPSWVILAGILVAALAMYALAWRIVEGTHIVVRAATRILLGALIVVPAILFIVFGNGAPMGEKASAPAPTTAAQSEDAAKPMKKKVAAPTSESKDGASVAEQAEKAAKAEEQARKAEAERSQAAEAEAKQRSAEAEQARIAAEAEARRMAAEAEQAAAAERLQAEERTRLAAAPEMSGEVAAPSAGGAEDNRRALDEFLARRDAESAAGATQPADRDAAAEPTKTDDAPAPGSAAPRAGETTNRYYRRPASRGFSYGVDGESTRSGSSTSAGSGGGDGAGGGAYGGLSKETEAVGTPGDLTLSPSLETSGPAVPTAVAPLPEVTAMPDVSAPDIASGAGGSAAPVETERTPDIAAMETAPPEEAVRAPEVAAVEAAPPPAAPPAAAEPPTVAAPEAAEVQEDWSVVPVFYGTDRARADDEKRIGYDWQRGRRMELGRALVTIPKEHVVPMVERPWAIKIPYVDIVLYEAAEDPKKHFTMKELKALTKEEFLNLVKERLQKSARFKDHALVFIHGYKTKFDNAVYRTAQIAYDLKFDGAPFLYSWPSGGTLQGYTYDRESAAQAELYLRQFLEMVRDETGAKKVSIIAHSMGNQLLLRTLQDMKRSMPEGVQISQLILAAPDVDRDSFEHIVKSIEGIAEGITLYAASNDTALSFSRQVNGGIPRAGDVPDGGPIVMEGIDTIDATATSMDSVGINHSGYAENNALLEDIGKLVAAGIRPPGIRLPKLERVETDKGAYWRYPSKQP